MTVDRSIIHKNLNPLEQAREVARVKRAMTGAGKFGLARQPFGALIVMGRVSPEFCGMIPWTALSSRTERRV